MIMTLGKTLGIALIAGCAAALMFASVVSGTYIALLLIYLAPLPLMVAAIGWGPLSAVLGGLIGCATLGVLLDFDFAGAFALSVAAPAAWFGHLVLLAQPKVSGADHSNHTSADLEWYPTGRILLWIVGGACVLSAATLATLGTDSETIHAALRSSVERIFGAALADIENPDSALDAIARIAPAVFAMVTTVVLSFNLWLAAKLVALSGQLHRPWPDLRQITLPRVMLVVMLVAVGLGFTSGLPALFGQLLAGALLMAYSITGFAALHVLTMSSTVRPLWLSVAYASVVIFAWQIVIIAALGITDSIVGLRSRSAAGRPSLPQPPHS
jgi:hypothetical protein